MVVAQLVEGSLLTPEIRSLYPNIGKITNCSIKNRKERNKETEAVNGQSFYNKNNLSDGLRQEMLISSNSFQLCNHNQPIDQKHQDLTKAK